MMQNLKNILRNGKELRSCINAENKIIRHQVESFLMNLAERTKENHSCTTLEMDSGNLEFVICEIDDFYYSYLPCMNEIVTERSLHNCKYFVSTPISIISNRNRRYRNTFRPSRRSTIRDFVHSRRNNV